MRRSIASVFSAFALTFLAAGCSSSATTSSTNGAGSKETFCALLIAFRASNESLDADVNSGDVNAARTAVQRLVAQGKTLQQQAPADIEPDAAVVAAFLVQLDALLAKYSYDLTKVSSDPAAAEAYTALNSADVQAALDQLRAYGDTDCADAPTTTSAVVTATTLTPVPTSSTG